jgi:ligand-binding SRPBCC domain-containing protein
MATEIFEHRYYIAAPTPKIYAHMSDPRNYVGLSPLVVQVDNISYETDDQGRKVCWYESVELFRFLGFIHYRNRIRVKTTFTVPDGQIVSEVDSPFNIQVRFVFDFQPEDGGTLMRETVTASMPGLLRGFVIGQAKSVQWARARILAERMEGES